MSTITISERPVDSSEINEWKKQVLLRDEGACVNCEKTRHVAACWVIPPEAGGRLRVANGVTVCRECKIAAESERFLPQRIDDKTPINFFISKSLHDSVQNYIATTGNFGSVSALIRHMISSFITTPELFEDIAQWQDSGAGSSAVKVNGWVPGSAYLTFQKMCQERDMSYTDVFKALLLVAIDNGNHIYSNEGIS